LNKEKRMRLGISVLAAGSLLLFVLIVPSASSQPPSTPPPSPPPPSPPAAAANPDAVHIAEIKKQIAGKENEPAETVYKNIQILKGMPALQLLGIMKFAYAGSLGVRCEHCHNTQNWASDEKTEKKVARLMSQMTRDINEKQLKPMTGLKSEEPVVNCTTCHRGQVKPALDLEPAPAAGS
jgi:hypothetical protein